MHITISKRTAALVTGAVILLLLPGVAAATHIFSDVAHTDVHAPGIEWAASSGVTAGCGDGTAYCPDDPVTRAQMATFLHRVSGQASGVAPSVDADLLDGLDSSAFLGVGDKAADADLLDGLDSSAFLGVGDTAVDADKVDGRHANELIRLASDETQVPVPIPGFLSTTIDVPMDGFLLMSGSANIFDPVTGGPFPVDCAIELDGSQVASSLRVIITAPLPPPIEEVCASDAVEFVPVGPHVVNFVMSAGPPTTQFGPATVWVLFVPFDGFGA